jgi:predicted TIM-barrel fold metal-dependent hydrolase
MALFGAGGIFGGLSGLEGPARPRRSTTGDLQSAIEAMPVVDVHGHGWPVLTPLTEQMFLEELALGSWMLDVWFPDIEGKTAYTRWKEGAPDERARLDRQYGIQRRLDEVCYHMRTTVFVDYLIKELAAFFRCKPTLKDVIAARNEATQRNFWGYNNELFASAKLEGMFIQGGLTAWTTPPLSVSDFQKGLKAKVHNVITAWADWLMDDSNSLDELDARYRAYLTEEVKKGGVAFKSGIVKTTGADVQVWSREEVEEAWREYKKLNAEQRERLDQQVWRPLFWKKIQDHILWETCELGYQMDIPVHIHSGNGEGMDLLSTHYPYKLENVVRYPGSFPLKPVKVVMIHGGYPHVDEAAYLSHIFPNVWYDLSLLNPIANRGLHQRLLTIFETAPMSKLMHGSDGYHLPEFHFAAAKWGKRYLASALAVLVDEGVYTKDEAIKYARMILGENALRLHQLDGKGGGTTPSRQ